LGSKWNIHFVALVHFARRFGDIFLRARRKEIDLGQKTAALFDVDMRDEGIEFPSIPFGVTLLTISTQPNSMAAVAAVAGHQQF
jgi:hypothetical protein